MTSLPPVLIAATALTVAALSQPPPADFSGTWTMDRERSESPQQDTAFDPPTLVITQSDTELAIETRRTQSTSRTVYTIGPKSAPVDAGASSTPRAYWEGATLVSEAARTVQGQTVSVRETRRLDPASHEMIVETLLVVQHGYTFKGARNYGAARDVYRRTAP